MKWSEISDRCARLLDEATSTHAEGLELYGKGDWFATPAAVPMPKPRRDAEIGAQLLPKHADWVASHALVWHRKAREIGDVCGKTGAGI
eukprot:8003693-Pyramimonas_sp.AAC.1